MLGSESWLIASETDAQLITLLVKMLTGTTFKQTADLALSPALKIEEGNPNPLSEPGTILGILNLFLLKG